MPIGVWVEQTWAGPVQGKLATLRHSHSGCGNSRTHTRSGAHGALGKDTAGEELWSAGVRWATG